MGKPYKNGENGGESSFLTSLLQRRAGNSWSAIIPSYHSCPISPFKVWSPDQNVSITWGLVRNAHSQAPPSPSESEIGRWFSSVCFNKSFRGF